MTHRNGNIPPDAKILERRGFLGFPTRIRYQLPGTQEVEWISRRQRKRKRRPLAGQTNQWWESVRISQGMCVLFMIGSFAFALGALLCFDLSLPARVPTGIFFLGSLFFTSAAYLQFLEAINVPEISAKALAAATDHASYFAWEPDRIDWWSTITQLVGTLYFNFSTFNALRMNLSLFIGVSAITSFIRPGLGEMVSANATNLFTALGGMCFFAGALLQLLETNRENAGEKKDHADNIPLSIPDTSHMVEGQRRSARTSEQNGM